MKDVRIALEELKEESDSGQLAAVPQPQRRSGTMGPGRCRRVVLLGAAGVALWWRPTATPAPVEWLLRPLTADSGLTTAPALSPDGNLVVYTSDRASNDANLDLWVQPLTEGSRPIRLTQSPANESSPSFSPDGGTIVFERFGDGIYMIPSLGGEERLLVRGARHARFSPDGRWIAYALGITDGVANSRVSLMPASGGAAKGIAIDIPWSGRPVWSPNGKQLLVLGTTTTNMVEDSLEFWLVSLEGKGRSVKLELASLLRARQMQVSIPTGFSVDWIGDALYFGSGSSIWTIGFKGGSPQPATLRKLASGTTDMVRVRGTTSKLVFASSTTAFHLWSLPLESNSGKVRGPMQPLAHTGGSQTMPASSSDGGRLVYRQSGPSSQELRLRDMNSGIEHILTTERARPKISPDGTRICVRSGSSWPPLSDGLLGRRSDETLGPGTRNHNLRLERGWETDYLLGWRSSSLFFVRLGNTQDVGADLPSNL